MQIKEWYKNRIALSTAILIGVILICAAIAYFFKLYPAAMVGGEFISIRSLEQSIAIAKRFQQTPDKAAVYNQLIESEQKNRLVSKFRIETKDGVLRELNYYKNGNELQYNKFLSDYFSGDEKLFIKHVVEPQSFDASLRIKYNSDFSINKDEYAKAVEVISRINDGESFEELAQELSDDLLTGQLGGDLGFVGTGQLLPELEAAVSDAKLGEVRKEIEISRFGYHILFPVETAEKDGQKVLHIKHILIKTVGFDQWLEQQLNSIGVYRFVKI